MIFGIQLTYLGVIEDRMSKYIGDDYRNLCDERSYERKPEKRFLHDEPESSGHPSDHIDICGIIKDIEDIVNRTPEFPECDCAGYRLHQRKRGGTEDIRYGENKKYHDVMNKRAVLLATIHSPEY